MITVRLEHGIIGYDWIAHRNMSMNCTVVPLASTLMVDAEGGEISDFISKIIGVMKISKF